MNMNSRSDAILPCLNKGFSREHWQMFADLGWLGIAIPKAFGGLGGDAVDVIVVMEAFGNGLVVEPLLTTAILGAGLLREAGTTAQKQAVLPAVARGESLLAFGFAEARSRSELDVVNLRATREGAVRR
jgi:alkylation response protein AidB-like acyl-CoA dehydrogenase